MTTLGIKPFTIILRYARGVHNDDTRMATASKRARHNTDDIHQQLAAAQISSS